ncbi:hypothetical protein L9F63_018329, partial [Diploptera punctata]
CFVGNACRMHRCSCTRTVWSRSCCCSSCSSSCIVFCSACTRCRTCPGRSRSCTCSCNRLRVAPCNTPCL